MTPHDRQAFVGRSRFAATGLFCALIDALLFQWLMNHGDWARTVHIMSFLAIAAFNYRLISQWRLLFHSNVIPDGVNSAAFGSERADTSSARRHSGRTNP